MLKVGIVGCGMIGKEHAKGAELSLENATEGLTVPFHAGAAKYFEEKGIEVSTK